MSDKKELIDHFFDYLSYLGNPENKIDIHSLQKFLSDECVIQSNNEILCRGIHEFISYINRMQQKYQSVKYSNFLEEPMLSQEKAVLYFYVHCVDRVKQTKNLAAMAILTIQNGKICNWTEVFHEIEIEAHNLNR